MEGQVLPPYSKEQKAAAHAALARVEALADECGSFVTGLETNFVLLGQALNEVKTNEYWMVGGHSNFKTYIETDVAPRVNRKHAILRAYMGVADDLLPYVPENELSQIGITKAMALRKVVTAGLRPSRNVIEKAIEKSFTANELKALIAEEHHVTEPGQDPMRYFDLGAIPLSQEEHDELLHVINLTLRTDPPINVGGPVKKISDLPPYAMKEVVFRWVESVVVEYMAELNASGLNYHQPEKSSESSEASEPPSSPKQGSSSGQKRKRSKNSVGTSSSQSVESVSAVATG